MEMDGLWLLEWVVLELVFAEYITLLYNQVVDNINIPAYILGNIGETGGFKIFRKFFPTEQSSELEIQKASSTP